MSFRHGILVLVAALAGWVFAPEFCPCAVPSDASAAEEGCGCDSRADLPEDSLVRRDCCCGCGDQALDAGSPAPFEVGPAACAIPLESRTETWAPQAPPMALPTWVAQAADAVPPTWGHLPGPGAGPPPPRTPDRVPLRLRIRLLTC